ncbi:3-phenylpropionate-dihydrodiol/cinnamic acid-dihydrodiol dehydrogenase [Alphaproteobacteria bacterium SO-S41]|nr:3-phenylpropionate-dihydrodiol/cinnamic acid-dihydrodiol dehydrogenase [Alphaproteobacteria bacterium SO-S41]
MTQTFDGATVAITGGATGLGAAVATLAAARGAKVVILDINEADGRRLAGHLGGQFHRCDVADPAAWHRLADAIGPVDYLHLNAGIMTVRPGESLAEARIDNVSYERYRAVAGVNIDGVFLGIQTMLPRMIAQGGHAITVTSSAAGLAPIPFDPIYAMTKHAVIGLVRSMALASADHPVRINAFCPGGIDTRIVPLELSANASNMMAPAVAAEEVVQLLLTGPSGEVRLKLRAGQAGQSVPPPSFTLG